MARQILDPRDIEIVQSRVNISWTTVEEYEHDMREKATFPPIRVRFDGKTLWCGDGCHRIHAARQAGFQIIVADVEPGNRRDAILDAAGANAEHGLRRSNDDKRRAVRMLLEDEEWSQWSDRKIARKCKVSHPFVSKMREELSGNVSRYEPSPNLTGNVSSERKAERNGTIYTVDTAGISQSNRQRACLDPSVPREQRIDDAVKKLPAANRRMALSLLRRYGTNYGDERLDLVLAQIHTGKHDNVQKAIIAATQAALQAGDRSAYEMQDEPIPIDASVLEKDIKTEKAQKLPGKKHRQPAPRPARTLRPTAGERVQPTPLVAGNGGHTSTDNGPADDQVIKQITSTLGQALLDGHPGAWHKLAARLGIDAPEGTEIEKLAAAVAYRVLWGERVPEVADIRLAKAELEERGIVQ